MKDIKLNLKRITISLLFVSILSSNTIYVKAADYNFKYTDQYLEDSTLQESINDNTLEVIDEETGKKVKYQDYRKKYEKRYASYAKLTEPVYPEEPTSTKSVYKSPDKTAKSKIYNSVNKSAVNKKEKELGIKMTDQKGVRNYNGKKFKKIEKLTGIKTNEKFYEESIKNTLTYIERKTASQIHNANNPYRNTIERILKKPTTDDSKAIQTLAYSLFYNVKYESDLLDFENYIYDIPYAWLLGGKTKGTKVTDVFNYRSGDIKMLFLDGKQISDNYQIPKDKKTNEEYIETYNEAKLAASESEGKVYQLIGNNYTDLIYNNAFGFDCWFLMGDGLYKANFYFYKDKLILADIQLQSSGRPVSGKNVSSKK